MLFSSLHTHNTFCDGKNTIEEMIEEAIKLGFSSIGISSHAYTGYSFDECGIKKDSIEDYFKAVEDAKERYKDKIDVFLGMEEESRIEGEKRPILDSRLDYAIGSVHLFRTPRGFFSVDNTVEEWREANEAYDGDTLLMIEEYLKELTSFSQEIPFDIVGHFDLYTKFNEKEKLFDEGNKDYKALAIEYLDKIIETGKIFEINTGAISRGYKTRPYPAPFLIERLKEKKAPIIITSDAHSTSALNTAYKETREMLISIGITKQATLTKKGWTYTPL